MKIKQIKINFNVTKDIERFVYVYLIETDKGCCLIDSGVAGSEAIIENAVMEQGHQPSDVKCIFLTHAHPDHIGTANYFREKYGTEIYASEGERRWIEDIDLQYTERPIPNFYTLAGSSTPVDHVVKDGDVVSVLGNLEVSVMGTPGHSADEVSYRIGDMIFIGDAVPMRGDIPIFINLEKTRATLDILENLTDVEMFYPAWDKSYSSDVMKHKIAEAKEIVNGLEKAVSYADNGMEISELVDIVCERMRMPILKTNPLFARTVACCRKERKKF